MAFDTAIVHIVLLIMELHLMTRFILRRNTEYIRYVCMLDMYVCKTT